MTDSLTPESTIAQKLIQHFRMEKIPAEGPWFTVTYRSQDVLDANGLPARYEGSRVAGTAIYAVQTTEDFSALHKLATDEIWHFYGGDPLEMLLLYPDGHGEVVVIGPDAFKEQHPQFVVPRNVWQGSMPIGAGSECYSFFGNTLAPGFGFDDFEIGYRDELQEKYPQFSDDIARLTRADFVTRR
jgi:predicted cupin superfamily sugar epimerase